VIPNGVDLAVFSDRGGSNRLRTVVTVANLRPEKSHETLIAAAASLADSHPELRYQIVGDGPRRGELEALAVARGVADRVQFLGHREDVPAILAAADAFVLPSRSEAFPNGAIEAMAAGLPVIASAVGGLVDLIDHGRTGLLTAPGDSASLASALQYLIDDRERAMAIGRAARAEVQRRYSFDRMIAAFEDLYLAGLTDSLSERAQRVQPTGV
jgi:glycosyltransferase involved in cell wall biosynthesis